eukprot:g14830.t1
MSRCLCRFLKPLGGRGFPGSGGWAVDTLPRARGWSRALGLGLGLSLGLGLGLGARLWGPQSECQSVEDGEDARGALAAAKQRGRDLLQRVK